MIYKHEKFKLNSDIRKVYNKHGEEVNISGHTYMLLELLCSKYPRGANLEDINLRFDIAGAKDYSEDYIRNLRSKIKSILNEDVVDYKNQIYTIIGQVDSYEKEPENLDYPRMSSEAETKNDVSRATFDKRYIFIGAFVVLAVAATVFIISRSAVKNRLMGVQMPVDDMVLIPAGEFIIGSTEEEIRQALEWCKRDEGNYCVPEDYYAEYPSHKESTPDFLIDKKEVSNYDYNKFIQTTKRQAPNSRYINDENFNGLTQPAVGVTWEDASLYCAWAGKRLPTEIEWEKAARGTDGRIWPWGATWDEKLSNHGTGGTPGLDNIDGFLYTSPVGATSDVSPYGVLNMAGNVFEWVDGTFVPYPGNDRYDHEEYKFNTHIYRGGSYYSSMTDLRTGSRGYAQPEETDAATGFRCAKDK